MIKWYLDLSITDAIWLQDTLEKAPYENWADLTYKQKLADELQELIEEEEEAIKKNIEHEKWVAAGRPGLYSDEFTGYKIKREKLIDNSYNSYTPWEQA